MVSVPHRLDAISESDIPLEACPITAPEGPPSLRAPRAENPQPVKHWEVYVDDLIGMVQGSPKHLHHVNHFLLASLDKILRRLDPEDGIYQQEPALVKKILAGDATWATRKVVLGWLLETLDMLIELPPHRLVRLLTIFDTIGPHQCRTTVKKWLNVLWGGAADGSHHRWQHGFVQCTAERASAEEREGTKVHLSTTVHEMLIYF
jgi:hypothetical protein